MAQVTFTNLAAGIGMEPGETHHWWWNNAGNDRVWSFSVDPYAIWDGAKWNPVKAEITKVYEVHKYSPGTAIGNPSEREIHVMVKNTGNYELNYELFMSSIRA
jgi:hypothetical protein